MRRRLQLASTHQPVSGASVQTCSPAFSRYTVPQYGHLASPVRATSRYTFGWLFPASCRPWGRRAERRRLGRSGLWPGTVAITGLGFLAHFGVQCFESSADAVERALPWPLASLFPGAAETGPGSGSGVVTLRQPVGVLGIAATNDVEEGALDFSVMGPARAHIVPYPVRSGRVRGWGHFSGRAGEEGLVGDVHLVARDALLHDLQAQVLWRCGTPCCG